MPDIVDAKTRSRMMLGIKNKNTQPELLVRRALHRQGFRFRLHTNSLPGKPDIVFPRLNAAILVHGCFWHAHECSLFKLPATRRMWWKAKLLGNRARDERVQAALVAAGWRTMTVWECALKNRNAAQLEAVVKRIVSWLHSEVSRATIAGPRKKGRRE